MPIKQNPVDCPFHAPREWLFDEGYPTADIQTPDQMRKAAKELLERGQELIEVARDALEEIERIERAGGVPSVS
ncbi:TPA: hypothetical protein ACGW3M_000988 [Pseudomonas aeruginosa]|uniref:hypothetical protein n=1 Tax=Pseudomonas aeruginosa TaxID=287 RepID=UPI0027FE1B00|nr:hypothetical protein [Pseudomonas aeruginosa]ELJ2276194.1 hypothetical protein [Pseudomonas aeruginosa]MBX6653730.1 hypothetical protein [Pseudomonas aeruginosa]MCS8413381.1 hypothetical protein [Pseudomonas aeruginosa]MCS9764312.1 hypothetical protein [Pseudomonas aeruginosa]